MLPPLGLPQQRSALCRVHTIPPRAFGRTIWHPGALKCVINISHPFFVLYVVRCIVLYYWSQTAGEQQHHLLSSLEKKKPCTQTTNTHAHRIVSIHTRSRNRFIHACVTMLFWPEHVLLADVRYIIENVNIHVPFIFGWLVNSWWRTWRLICFVVCCVKMQYIPFGWMKRRRTLDQKRWNRRVWDERNPMCRCRVRWWFRCVMFFFGVFLCVFSFMLHVVFV